MVSVDVKHHERRVSELRSCVNREVGLASHSLSTLPPSLISHTVSVDVKRHGRRLTERGEGFGVNMVLNVHRNHKAY